MCERELAVKCRELGERISQDYGDKAPPALWRLLAGTEPWPSVGRQNPLLVGVLNGAAVFMADLVRCVKVPGELEFISVGSYGAKAKKPQWKKSRVGIFCTGHEGITRSK